VNVVKDCNQCGKCCLHYGDGGLSASASEIEWWENARPNIYAYVKNGNIWVDPSTGEPLKRCPWLQQEPNQGKYTCAIYHDRPEDCRHYPTSIAEMVRDECEMIEIKDLQNPKRAQQALDVMMSDSRPAFLKP